MLLFRKIAHSILPSKKISATKLDQQTSLPTIGTSKTPEQRELERTESLNHLEQMEEDFRSLTKNSPQPNTARSQVAAEALQTRESNAFYVTSPHAWSRQASEKAHSPLCSALPCASPSFDSVDQWRFKYAKKQLKKQNKQKSGLTFWARIKNLTNKKASAHSEPKTNTPNIWQKKWFACFLGSISIMNPQSPKISTQRQGSQNASISSQGGSTSTQGASTSAITDPKTSETSEIPNTPKTPKRGSWRGFSAQQLAQNLTTEPVLTPQPETTSEAAPANDTINLLLLPVEHFIPNAPPVIGFQNQASTSQGFGSAPVSLRSSDVGSWSTISSETNEGYQSDADSLASASSVTDESSTSSHTNPLFDDMRIEPPATHSIGSETFSSTNNDLFDSDEESEEAGEEVSSHISNSHTQRAPSPEVQDPIIPIVPIRPALPIYQALELTPAQQQSLQTIISSQELLMHGDEVNTVIASPRLPAPEESRSTAKSTPKNASISEIKPVDDGQESELTPLIMPTLETAHQEGVRHSSDHADNSDEGSFFELDVNDIYPRTVKAKSTAKSISTSPSINSFINFFLNPLTKLTAAQRLTAEQMQEEGSRTQIKDALKSFKRKHEENLSAQTWAEFKNKLKEHTNQRRQSYDATINGTTLDNSRVLDLIRITDEALDEWLANRSPTQHQTKVKAAIEFFITGNKIDITVSQDYSTERRFFPPKFTKEATLDSTTFKPVLAKNLKLLDPSFKEKPPKKTKSPKKQT